MIAAEVSSVSLTLNNVAFVVLTDKGVGRLRAYDHEEGVPVGTRKIPDDRQFGFPVWELMMIFGPAMSHGVETQELFLDGRITVR